MHANLGQLRLSSLLLYSGSLFVFPSALSFLLSLSRTFFPLSFLPFSFFSPSPSILSSPSPPSVSIFLLRPRLSLPDFFYHSRCPLFYFSSFFILLVRFSLTPIFFFFLSLKFYFYSLPPLFFFTLANCFSFFFLCSLFVSNTSHLSFFPFLFAPLFFLSPRSFAIHDLSLFTDDIITEQT